MEIITITDIITEIDRAQQRIKEWSCGILDLSYLLLYKLPPIPNSVTHLYCAGCHLTELIIPDHVTYIDCSNNPLNILPNLPHRLYTLICDNTRLTRLPPLPSTLQRLICRNNPLKCLPDLPEGLIEILCMQTSIESLPPLPSTIQTLKCGNNRLMSLPPLPDSLRMLDCSINLITELPPLPLLLNELDCRLNPISKLPDIHPRLSYLLCNDQNEWVRRPNETMYQHVDRVKELTSQRRVNARCSMIKEGIMMKAWHPSRVERLLLAGFDIEDM